MPIRNKLNFKILRCDSSQMVPNRTCMNLYFGWSKSIHQMLILANTKMLLAWLTYQSGASPSLSLSRSPHITYSKCIFYELILNGCQRLRSVEEQDRLHENKHIKNSFITQGSLCCQVIERISAIEPPASRKQVGCDWNWDMRLRAVRCVSLTQRHPYVFSLNSQHSTHEPWQ